MTTPLDLVFMGTPEFAATILNALIQAGHRIVAAYSQPPRPAGRGHRLQPSPVQLSSANWGVCDQNLPTTAISVSASGLARCAAGAVGTYTVWAWAERAGYQKLA